jgi:hypothetical protein
MAFLNQEIFKILNYFWLAFIKIIIFIILFIINVKYD